jgi:hypothetical protein
LLFTLSGPPSFDLVIRFLRNDVTGDEMFVISRIRAFYVAQYIRSRNVTFRACDHIFHMRNNPFTVHPEEEIFHNRRLGFSPNLNNVTSFERFNERALPRINCVLGSFSFGNALFNGIRGADVVFLG